MNSIGIFHNKIIRESSQKRLEDSNNLFIANILYRLEKNYDHLMQNQTRQIPSINIDDVRIRILKNKDLFFKENFKEKNLKSSKKINRIINPILSQRLISQKANDLTHKSFVEDFENQVDFK